MSYFNNIPHADSRIGLGYGTYDKFHKPKSASSSFPYIEDDYEDDDEIFYDEQFLLKMINKIGDLKSNDPLSYKSADSGSQKDFMSKMNTIGEVTTHMSPIPNLYKNKSAVSGGTASPTSKGFIGYSEKTKPTGSKKGWSNSPPRYNEPIEDKNLEKIRKLIRMIHISQEEK